MLDVVWLIPAFPLAGFLIILLAGPVVHWLFNVVHLLLGLKRRAA